MNKNFTKLSVCALLLCGSGMYAQTDSTTTETTTEGKPIVEETFFELSLEDLANIEVTSVSKKAERLQDVAASMYVLTQEDIAKSSATTIHELLREVPGYWGVQDEYNNVIQSGMRFSSTENDGNAGTVLYLLDGTPIQDLMSSSFSQRNFDIPLDEIERVEIIKGSGGVIYGANSATGVVNIFTKTPEKYDGLHARVEAAWPGYGNATLRGGGKVNDKLAISGYGKMRYMEGYGLLPEFDGDSVTVAKNDGSGDVKIKNSFTENYEKTISFALGLKLKYNLSDKTSVSLNTHFNTMQKGSYTNYYPAQYMGQVDEKVYKKNNSNRIVSNIRLDHEFSENHSLFFRVSNNFENDYLKTGGGANISNGIIDFEIQDNLTLGIQDLSFGGNFRLVNFDVHDINSTETINYVNPQSNETLAGFFVQDKVRIIEDKLDLLVGVKGETYSLINNNIYFSPMAKASYRPTQKVTLWGGFTQSYTTPGFNNTNIDLKIFSAAPSSDFFYGQAYQQAIAGGATPAQADAIAQQEAAKGAAAYPGSYNIGVKNGSETSPTKFQTAEFGLKAKILEKFQFESNFFYSWISDGIGVSESPINIAVESPTNENERGDYYLYGNYVKGTSIGTETFLRYRPKKEIMLEFSHTWLQSRWEYQKNADFDINLLSDNARDRTPTVSTVPGHIWRVRGWYEFAKVYSVSGSAIYGTKYNKQATYQYEQQRYRSVVGAQFGQSGTTIAGNSDRVIINLKVERKFANEKLSVYLFGNDVLNNGNIEGTSSISNTTLSKIGGMYGLGAILKIK